MFKVDNSHAYVRSPSDASPDLPDTGHGARTTPEASKSVASAKPAQAFLQRVSGAVDVRDRAMMFQQKAVTVWLTGLSGAGKSTIAYEL